MMFSCLENENNGFQILKYKCNTQTFERAMHYNFFILKWESAYPPLLWSYTSIIINALLCTYVVYADKL